MLETIQHTKQEIQAKTYHLAEHATLWAREQTDHVKALASQTAQKIKDNEVLDKTRTFIAEQLKDAEVRKAVASTLGIVTFVAANRYSSFGNVLRDALLTPEPKVSEQKAALARNAGVVLQHTKPQVGAYSHRHIQNMAESATGVSFKTGKPLDRVDQISRGVEGIGAPLTGIPHRMVQMARPFLQTVEQGLRDMKPMTKAQAAA